MNNYQSIIKKSNEKRNTDYFTKYPTLNQFFKYQNTQRSSKNSLQSSIPKLSITQKEFEQLAELLLKDPKVYATSKFDFGKVNSTLNLPDAVFKKQ